MADYGIKPPVDVGLIREHASLKRRKSQDDSVKEELTRLFERQQNAAPDQRTAISRELVAKQAAFQKARMNTAEVHKLRRLDIYAKEKAMNDRLLKAKTITQEEYDKRMANVRHRASAS
jgi:hypothetical protein